MEDLGGKSNGTKSSIAHGTGKKILFKFMDMHADVLNLVIDPAIEDHTLSNTTNTVISLNAHADEIIPPEMQFKTKLEPFDAKPRLFKDLGNQNWIKQLAQKMNTLNVIWIKPPWTKGVDDGHSSFNIKDKSESSHSVNLHVKTLGRSIFEDVQEDYDEFKAIFNKDLDVDSSYILDLELSFFSSDNSFTQKYEEWPEYYQFFTEIFKLKYPESKDEKDIKIAVKENRNNLSELELIFNHLTAHKTMPSVEGKPSILHEKVSHLREELLKHYTEKDIAWDHIYDAGLVCNDHQLPVHFTNREDIEKMVNVCVAKIIDLLPCAPRVITIAVMYEYLNFTKEADLDFIIDLLKDLFAKKFTDLDAPEFIGY